MKDFKKKTTIVKLEGILPNESSSSTYFSRLLLPSQPSVIVAGGNVDNSFKLIRSGEIIQSISFHKKPVTVVLAEYISRTNEYFIIVGSKDCRISVWKYDLIKKRIDETVFCELLYGHHNEIISIVIQTTLGIVVSADKDGVILIYRLMSKRLLNSITLGLNTNEAIKLTAVNSDGYIAVATNSNRLFIYTWQGKFLHESAKYCYNSNLSIKAISFLMKIKPLLLIANQSGDLIFQDFLKMIEVKKIKDDLLYTDRTKDQVSRNKLKQIMNNIPVSTFVLKEDEESIYLGYENGFLCGKGHNPDDEVSKLRENFTELGFEFSDLNEALG